jgi:glutaminase
MSRRLIPDRLADQREDERLETLWVENVVSTDEATDLYTRQCSLEVTVHDLAAMAATLANGGVNPMTGERVVVAGVCRRVLAVMATAGLYELSGDWLYEIGMPGKSGVSGGIVTVSPGKGGLATSSPPNQLKRHHLADAG